MLDIVLALIFIGAAITGFRKGFLKSLIGLFGNLIALFASYKLASPVALAIETQFGAVSMLAKKNTRRSAYAGQFFQYYGQF